MKKNTLNEKIALLIVDDRKDNLLILESLIKKHFPDVEIFKAVGAAEGIQIAAEKQVAGALIDVQMPKMDGIEMCRRLKADERTCGISVILLTSHETDPELRAKGLEVGADDFIHRPFDNAEFVARVKVMLRVKCAEDKLREMNEQLQTLVEKKIGEVQESEEKYRTRYENVPLSYQSLDENGCFLDVNPAWLETLGFDREEVIGEYFGDFLHPDWKAHFEENFPEFKRHGFVHDVQFKIRHKDGHYLDISFEGRIAYWPDGRVRHTYCVFQDITEYKRVEERIRHLNLVLHTIRDVNQLIVEEKNRDVLVQKTCKLLTERHGYENAWIVLLSQQREYLQSAESGLGDHFIPMKKMLKAGKLTECGIRTLEKRELTITENPEKDCVDCPLAAEYGGRVSYSGCLDHDGNIYGLLTVSASRAFVSDKEEQGLFLEVCGDISLALHSIEIEKKAMQAEKRALRFNKILESSINEIYIFDAKTLLFLDVNSGARENLGYSIEEFRKMTPLDIKPDFTAELFTELAAPLRNGDLKAVHFTAVHRRKDGTQYPVEVFLQLITDGSPVFAAIILDISERRKTEEKIRESEERFHIAFDASPDSININRLVDGLYVNVNDGFTSITGFTREETIGKTSREINIWGDFADREKLRKQLGETGVVSNMEALFRRKDGRLLTGLMSARLVQLNGEPHILSVTRDIEAIKLAENALKSSEERLKVIFENAPDAIYLHDFKGKFIDGNKMAEDILGYEKKELIGKSFLTLKILSAKEVVRAAKILAKNVRGKKTGPDEFNMIRKDGSQVPVEISAYPVKIEGKGLVLGIARDISERKKSEKALRENEQKMSIFVNQISLGVIEWDLDFRVKKWNPAAEKIFGYTQKEAMDRHSEFIIPENDRKEVDKVWSELLTGKEGIRNTNENMNKQGEAITCEWYNTPLVNDQGKTLAMTSLVHDITERRQAEESLRESEQFMTNVFESVQDGISVLKPDLEICHVNGVMNKWYQENVPLEGKKCYEVYHNANKPCDPCPSLRCLKSGHKELNVVPGLPGSPVEWIELFSFPIKDPDSGKITGVVEYVRDITNRKKAEADRERLSIAIEQAGEAIIITDKDGTIQYVNPAYEKITGYTSEEVIGENPRILNSGVQDGAFYKKMWETLASGETWSGRLVNRKKDGTLYSEEATISPVFDLSGKVVNYVGVKRDVTQELTMEEQFRQSQKMEAVGKLAGGVAHDFNNLLGVIMGYTELAQNQIGPDHGISKHLKAIERAAERSAGLTRQLLAFSRKQKLESKVINLNDLLKNLEKMLRRVIGEDIEFMTAYTDDLDKVEADPGQIEQIIMNLAVNARDAMPEGGKLTIESANVYLDERYARTHLGTIPGRYVMLAVLDTGSGMDEETRSRIFEPFFTTKEEGKGTGLGLSTVYGIVKQSGGHIWCYSEPDKGTTFEVYLPRTDAGLSRKKEGNAVKIAQGGSENILLVEDETEIRHLLKEMLKELNYNITVAENGIEALHLIEGKGFRPDLIITDVVMPHMGGKSLVDRVRKIVPDQKVLYMSGYTDHSAVQNGALDPDIPFIQKPFNFPDIAEKIKQALSGKG